MSPFDPNAYPPRTVGALALLVALVYLPGCASPTDIAPSMGSTSIRFQALIEGKPATCVEATAVEAADATVQLTDLRFYVHDVRFVDAEGEETPAVLRADGRWQTAEVALIDLEDGVGACRNGSPETREVIEVQAPNGSFVALRFRLGVPFDSNHANPATSPAPLNLTAMSWGWMGGHKFMRLEAEVDGRSHTVHLASTGCEGIIGAITGCARGNRPEIEVALSGRAPETVALHLDRLLGVSTAAQPETGGARTCMSGRADTDCASVFAGLGLDLYSGRPMYPATAFEGQ